ncbi:MAG: acetoin utilization protein AcuC [Thaumarchaeota archaeon]|nr:acetoin utilization protein AcuC [Candidatus Calditenuaceae archaeon]MDW8187100.1 acetoin utilization protein AcuC [Nitrososphaerota archaeon]
MPRERVQVAYGERLFSYGFGAYHPFNRTRTSVFEEKFSALLAGQSDLIELVEPEGCREEEVTLFHTPEYVSFVKMACSPKSTVRYLDYGDTPAFPNCFESACVVVGTTLKLLKSIASGKVRKAFSPIGGLHHATRAAAGGFCIFNDVGVAIEYALRFLGYRSIAYVDIDAHHGDGVYYEFEEDPRVVFFDIHQDGRTLYPGTGFEHERGKGEAIGRKMNVPLAPRSGDREFIRSFERGVEFLKGFDFDLVIFQCGADGLAGDPLTSLRYSSAAHRFAANSLVELAEEKCHGRILALGGGGYDPQNVGDAWITVVSVLAGIR